MIINPIIPIWLMSIICIVLSILIIYNKQLKAKVTNSEKTPRQKYLIKEYFISVSIKIAIVILLFIINLRFMLPDGESLVMNSDVNVLFVIDKSVSMKTLDYNGGKTRFEAVADDCCHIVDELQNCKFSIITFGDTAQKVIPFTTDTDVVQAELKAIALESEIYAKGSSMNLVKDVLEKTLKEEIQKNKGTSKLVVFFVSDGEITKEGETLGSFASIKQYISNGVVMGYGTTKGGKMLSSYYDEEEVDSEYYYVYYYNENYERLLAISKIDENNLKKIASDIGVDYVYMDKSSNINDKLKDIKRQISASKKSEEKIASYRDVYYYFAIPLVVLLSLDFVIKKRRIV